MRLGLVVLAFLCLTAPAGAAPHLRILVERAHLQGGKALMPVRCLGGVCRGRVRIGRAVAGFALPRKGVTTLRFKAAPGLHAVKIVVRHGRSSSTTLKVTRVRDRITCGYGPLANQLQRVGGARMFYVIRDSLDESGFEDTRTLLVCRDGVALQLVTENGDAESQRFYGEVLTTGWAGALFSGCDRYGNCADALVYLRLSDGRGGGASLNQRSVDGVAYTPAALAIGEHGGMVIKESAPTGAAVRVFDSLGDRIVASGPSVDFASIGVEGDTASWIEDGHMATADLAGPPSTPPPA